MKDFFREFTKTVILSIIQSLSIVISAIFVWNTVADWWVIPGICSFSILEHLMGVVLVSLGVLNYKLYKYLEYQNITLRTFTASTITGVMFLLTFLI